MKANDESVLGRTCVSCGELKPIVDFGWKRKSLNQRSRRCRSCQSVYQRKHYLDNREDYLRRTASRNQAMRTERARLIVKYLEEHPCVDCGEPDVVVLDFDHLFDKSFDISRGLHGRNWDSVLAEIAKCEVVCANCHRRRTYSRNPTLRSVLAMEPPKWSG
jgi:hypothetical protein